MRIVVTGSTGNVGTSLVRRLAADPDVDEVIGIERRSPRRLPAGVQHVTADVARDDLRRHFEGADAVVHLAWEIQPSRDEAQLEATNVEGSRRVFGAVAQAGVPVLVHASSLGAYSPGHQPAAAQRRAAPCADLQGGGGNRDPTAVRRAAASLAAPAAVARARRAVDPAAARPGRPRRRRRRGLQARGGRPPGARRLQRDGRSGHRPRQPRRRVRGPEARASGARGAQAHRPHLASSPSADPARMARHGAGRADHGQHPASGASWAGRPGSRRSRRFASCSTA